MVEIIRNNGERESLKKGDLILVLGENEDREVPGTVKEIDNNGTVWMNYGGCLTPLHDADQIRIPPEEMQEELLIKLKEDEERLKNLIQDVTGPLRDALVEYDKRHRPFGWLLDLFK